MRFGGLLRKRTWPRSDGFVMPRLGPTRVVVVSCLLLATLPTQAADPLRDLSQYEVAGPYKMSFGQPHAEYERLEGQLREFLWVHWRRHQRGSVVATHQWVEGFVRTSYFVEPDGQGRWMIVEYTDYPYSPKFKGNAFSCAEFERVEPDRLHLPLIAIPNTESRPAEMYLLHPICSKGKDAKLW
jgi:hypothetical protein